MFLIAWRELYSLFLSPLAWVLLGVSQLILGWFFAWRVNVFLQPDMQGKLAKLSSTVGVTELVVGSLFVLAAILLMLMTPLVTMRLISEERRNKTLALLLSAPLSITQIILGKYLGVLLFFGILIGMISIMPLTLLFISGLDLGQLLAGILGLSLMTAAFCAIGLYISTLTDQPSLAAMGSFAVLFFLWIIDSALQQHEAGQMIWTYLSLTSHYQNLLRGLFDTADIIYYLLLIFLFLMLSIQRLDEDRF